MKISSILIIFIASSFFTSQAFADSDFALITAKAILRSKLCPFERSFATLRRASSERSRMDEAELKTRLLNKVRAENLSLNFLHDHRKPIRAEPSDKKNELHYTNTISSGLRWTLLIPITFHQKVITHQDGPTCTFIPSCSAYGYEAVKRYGLLGILMTADRLLRCHGGNRQYYPSIRNYAYDPVK